MHVSITISPKNLCLFLLQNTITFFALGIALKIQTVIVSL